MAALHPQLLGLLAHYSLQTLITLLPALTFQVAKLLALYWVSPSSSFCSCFSYSAACGEEEDDEQKAPLPAESWRSMAAVSRTVSQALGRTLEVVEVAAVPMEAVAEVKAPTPPSLGQQPAALALGSPQPQPVDVETVMQTRTTGRLTTSLAEMVEADSSSLAGDVAAKEMEVASAVDDSVPPQVEDTARVGSAWARLQARRARSEKCRLLLAFREADQDLAVVLAKALSVGCSAAAGWPVISVGLRRETQYLRKIRTRPLRRKTSPATPMCVAPISRGAAKMKGVA